jgi:hypothetical protein
LKILVLNFVFPFYNKKEVKDLMDIIKADLNDAQPTFLSYAILQSRVHTRVSHILHNVM